MAIISMKGKHQLDEKLSWKKWLEVGSVDKLVKLGIPEFINPETNKPYSKRTIRCAAYRWAFKNLEESRKDWDEQMRNAGIPPTDETWKEWMAAKAKDAYRYQVGMYQRFVKENGLEGL